MFHVLVFSGFLFCAPLCHQYLAPYAVLSSRPYEYEYIFKITPTMSLNFIFDSPMTVFIKFQDHERRDDFMEMREGLDLTNVTFREVLLSRQDKDMPWYTHPAVYCLASLMVLSWPLRILIEFNTAHVHYQVTNTFHAFNICQ